MRQSSVGSGRMVWNMAMVAVGVWIGQVARDSTRW